MKYIKIFFSSLPITLLAYCSAVAIFIDSPIQAEYWVREMIVIKKALVAKHAGERKVIIAGGSSSLFGVDAEQASKDLRMPVINFGLHAGLKLKEILQESGTAADSGDLLILQLEPPYYECHDKPSEWQVENIIAWDHSEWAQMRPAEKAELVSLVSPGLLYQMIEAQYQRKFHPESISERLASFDNSMILSKFRDRASPVKFEYSAYHIDDYGDMLMTEGSEFKGVGFDPSKQDHICIDTKKQLQEFVERMNQKHVSVYFSHTPYIASRDITNNSIRESEFSFQQEFNTVGCFIDKREDLVFDRKYFFNSSLHLNNSGRAIRTTSLINSIRKNVFTGNCDLLHST